VEWSEKGKERNSRSCKDCSRHINLRCTFEKACSMEDECYRSDTSLNLIELLLRQTGSIPLRSLVQTRPNRQEDLKTTGSNKTINV